MEEYTVSQKQALLLLINELHYAVEAEIRLTLAKKAAVNLQ